MGSEDMIYYVSFSTHGDIAQLVERLNGIEKVRGSTPLISTIRLKIEKRLSPINEGAPRFLFYGKRGY